jgi:hypothetical protein
MTALPHQQLLAQTKVLRDQLHFCPENDQHRNRNTCDPARHHPSKSASTVSYQRPTLGDHVLRLTGGYSGEGCQADQSAGRQTAGFNKPSSGSFLRVIGHLLLLESGSDPPGRDMQTLAGERAARWRRDEYAASVATLPAAVLGPRISTAFEEPPKLFDASIHAMLGGRRGEGSRRPAFAYIVASGCEALRTA